MKTVKKRLMENARIFMDSQDLTASSRRRKGDFFAFCVVNIFHAVNFQRERLLEKKKKTVLLVRFSLKKLS